MSAPQAAEAPPSLPWRDALKVYLEPATLRMLALGFSAGLPLLLVLGTLSFRLREAGVDRIDHRLPELGRARLRLQVGVGAAGRPPADPPLTTAARAPARLAAAGAGWR